jgi:Bifunctional DNA primase/polymerase, N-terminal
MLDPDPARKRILDDALDYAARGFAVFPCKFRTKEPAGRIAPHGCNSATTNPETIRRWFGGTVRYNLAIRTGWASGVWVLDVDDRHGGFATLRQLEERYGPLPSTRCCKTANGVHLWWRATGPIGCSDDRVGRGLGVKGDGGGIMAPPSVHPDGPIYTWDNDEPLAGAPDWLIKLTRKPPPAPIVLPPRNHNGPPGAYGAAALQREIDALAMTAPGSRNHALNRASFSLHQLVAGGELDHGEVERRLLMAAEANGLMTDPNDGPRKVLATIRSGARAGLQHPRGRP